MLCVGVYSLLLRSFLRDGVPRFFCPELLLEHDGYRELQEKLRAEMSEHSKTKEALKEQEISTDAEHKFLLIERGKRVEQAEKISSLEAEVHDRDMTIMELKAKLYDLTVGKKG